MIRVGIAAAGLVAPGMATWEEGRVLLAQGAIYDPTADMPVLKPALLPANERRRTTPHIRLALQAAQDAIDAWQGDMAELATVFSSSDADLEIVDKILTSLNLPGSPVSPTHFHNSVHNAPAGYWSIVTGSHAPSTSLSAYDASFSAGLLEAAIQVYDTDRPVLLVASDMPAPSALHPFYPLVAPFGVALLLTPEDAGAITLGIELLHSDRDCDAMHDEGLETLRRGVPAARALPLLAALARGGAASLRLPGLPGQALELELASC